MSKKRRTLKRSGPPDLIDPGDTEGHVRALLHELQVHSEEITVQNEQLLLAQGELEDARDRYADLFDFAPIGYLILDSHGSIRQINLTATALLERSRSFLVGLPLINMVANHNRDDIRKLLLPNAAAAADVWAEVDLRTKEPRTVRLVFRQVTGRGGKHMLFTAMLDITAEKRLAAEKADAYRREKEKTAQLSAEVTTRIAAEERVKALLERLVTVQEQERRRLALNLHDHLGQQLTALRLAVSSLRDAESEMQRKQQFELVDKIVSQLDRDVDFLAWELRPAALDDVGLEAALTEFLRQWSWTNGTTADFHHSPNDGARLGADIESNLYRIVQEALNNISKHAAAKHVAVILERRAEEATLIVEDDGRGFDLADASSAGHPKGMGLAGIRERTALIGGNLEIESAPGKGTTLFVRIPLSASTPMISGPKS
jgi:PAS domain S-box-containing protein